MCTMDKPWVFYIIANGGRTYAGVSPDPVRRLRQHNGEIKGGAKYTTSAGPGWRHVCLVHGFRTKIEALQFEWAVKNEKPRKGGGMEMRARKLHSVLAKERWTSKAPPAKEVELKLDWKEPPCFTCPLPSYVSSSLPGLGSLDHVGLSQNEPPDGSYSVDTRSGVRHLHGGGALKGDVSPDSSPDDR